MWKQSPDREMEENLPGKFHSYTMAVKQWHLAALLCGHLISRLVDYQVLKAFQILKWCGRRRQVATHTSQHTATRPLCRWLQLSRQAPKSLHLVTPLTEATQGSYKRQRPFIPSTVSTTRCGAMTPKRDQCLCEPMHTQHRLPTCHKQPSNAFLNQHKAC